MQGAIRDDDEALDRRVELRHRRVEEGTPELAAQWTSIFAGLEQRAQAGDRLAQRILRSKHVRAESALRYDEQRRGVAESRDEFEHRRGAVRYVEHELTDRNPLVAASHVR